MSAPVHLQESQSFMPRTPPDTLKKVYTELEQLEGKMNAAVKQHAPLLARVHPQQLDAAKNLLHYMVLRNEDIRNLQDWLHMHGLSSLASSEAHIYSQVQCILQRLGKKYTPKQLSGCTYTYSRRNITQQAHTLFGEKKDEASPYIMVTFDASFADNYTLVKSLLQNGMNVARINCAHNDEQTWMRFIHQLQRAQRHTGLNCKIYMDLAGPKIRTRLLKKGKEKGKVKVAEGDRIWLADDDTGFSENDIVISPNEPGIISMLKKGERVFIDDGMVKGIIESVKKNRAALRLVRISSHRQQIKAEKGINFPDSDMTINPLTTFDKSCLPFICEQADMVGYSFVRFPSDLEALQTEIKKTAAKQPEIIIKVETPEAVKNLPALLLQGMKQKALGIMIARGDLAVEIGFERMSEIQEEILWISEAAHVPVIWATQVLESLNKMGMATRSEITDAAHAAMAECVMINKGPHTIEVMETLRDILQRVGSHHVKKRFMLRPLSIARSFLQLK